MDGVIDRWMDGCKSLYIPIIVFLDQASGSGRHWEPAQQRELEDWVPVVSESLVSCSAAGHPGAGVSHSQNHGHHRTNAQRHGGSPPLGLAKWFGSDVLQQPLPSMPAKVISVDELEFRP